MLLVCTILIGPDVSLQWCRGTYITMIMYQPLVVDISLDEGIFNITQLVIRFIPIQNLTIKDMISTANQLRSHFAPFLKSTEQRHTNDQTLASFPLRSISSVPLPKPHERSYQ
jgi:hypothetical protein